MVLHKVLIITIKTETNNNNVFSIVFNFQTLICLIDYDDIFSGDDDNFDTTVLCVSILTTVVMTGVAIGLVKT